MLERDAKESLLSRFCHYVKLVMVNLVV